MSVLKVKNGDQWDIVPAIKGDTGDPAADESITDDMLVTDGIKTEIEWLWGNQLTRELTGDVLTASDAYAAPPMVVTVDGKSTQDGTPTPAAPVEIVSIEQLHWNVATENQWANLDGGFVNVNGTISNPNPTFFEYVTDYIPVSIGDVLHVTNMADFSETPWIGVGLYDANKSFVARLTRGVKSAPFSVKYEAASYARVSTRTYGYVNSIIVLKNETPSTLTIPLSQPLRSLPDGTKDELHLSYLRPSKREGWAWYDRELVQKLHEITLNACTWLCYSATAFYTRGLNLPVTAGNVEVLCNIFKPSASKNLGGLANAEINSIQVLGRNELGIKTASEYQDASAFVASLDDSDVAVAKLATPITTQLDPIELPIMPSKDTTIWSDPATNLKMTYIQDTNLVIESLEATVADMATS